MNVFEDLIEELKEENLIEETVIETSLAESLERDFEQLQAESVQAPSDLEPENQTFATETSNNEFTVNPPEFQPPDLTQDFSINNDFSEPETMPDFTSELTPPDSFELNQQSSFSTKTDSEPIDIQPESSEEFELPQTLSVEKVEEIEALPNIEVNENQELKELFAEYTDEQPEVIEFKEAVNLQSPMVNEKEFFRRRATEEVNSLQIVEHIISAIEREQMKIVPKPYDDIAVSMALHDFLKVIDNPQSPEHAQTEFKLMQETEGWYSALSHRDKHISIGDLRRYCETAKPALSSQALISFARFYRNSPFSEAVRNKFDVIITRLLTKETSKEQRTLIFERDALIRHLSGLYADWSSIPLYDTDNDSDVLIGALKLEDFMSEASNSETFEDLIKNDFFNRLRLFKESTGEKFFSPLLTSTAIESNVLIGNKYVELLRLEKERNSIKSIEEKYRFGLDQPVSEAIGKTLQLIELLKDPMEELRPFADEQTPEIKETLKLESTAKYEPKETKTKRKFLGLSSWVWAFCLTLLLACGGLVVYLEYFAPQMKTSPSVKKVNLDNSSLKEYFKTARINRDTFFAVTQPAWDRLSKDVKEDVLKKTLAVGSEKGYNKIHLLNSEGKTVAFATENSINLDPK